MEQESNIDLDILTSIISSLKKLSKDDQQRTLQAVATFLNISLKGTTFAPDSRSEPNRPSFDSSPPGTSSFSEDRSISSKDFLREKDPRSDVDKVASIAYYLTHYRDTPYFKTLDISSLNTEAAQPKFSNASVAVENATKVGFLVQATKGNKQLSAAGERYVQLLPDKLAARSSIQGMRPKKRSRKPHTKKSESTQHEN